MSRARLQVYSIHVPPPYSAAEREPEAVRDGFSFPAFLLTVIWVLAHRMWLCALALSGICLVLALAALLLGIDAAGQAIVSLAFMAWVGMEAQDWRRAALARQGWREVGVVTAESADGALRRYWDIGAIGSNGAAEPSPPSSGGDAEPVQA